MKKFRNENTGEIVETNKFNPEFYTANNNEVIPKRFIENNTDWKKVEEVDYEIISSNLDYMATPMVRSINSVKRLSDGEVFTIGDEIKGYRHDFPYKVRCNDFVVTKIELDSNKISLHGKTFSKIQLKIAKKVKKQPLFKSIDGVDVYENDTVFCVLKGTCASREILIRKGYDNSPNNLWVGYFSTQEKADEYALMNKECLSLNDILNAWGGNDFLQNTADYKQSPLFNNFKKAVEAKQNPKSKGILAQEHINNIETFCTEIKYSIKK